MNEWGAREALSIADHLSDEDFRRVSGFIHDQYGICLPPSKKILLEGRLRRRIKRLGMTSFREYCQYLFTAEGMRKEVVAMVDAVTTNQTGFFREPFHFEFLAEKAIPALCGGERSAGGKRLSAWSAACSTGEEPYTLAMVLNECLRDRPGWDYSILATDISTQVLDQAAKAVYSQERVEPIPQSLRKKYLLRSRDEEKRLVRIVPELRQKVAFKRLNLIDRELSMKEPLQVIFCRNVMIYFDPATQERLIEQFHRLLAPGGYLFMGHAESVTHLRVSLHYVAPTIYQKGVS